MRVDFFNDKVIVDGRSVGGELIEYHHTSQSLKVETTKYIYLNKDGQEIIKRHDKPLPDNCDHKVYKMVYRIGENALTVYTSKGNTEYVLPHETLKEVWIVGNRLVLEFSKTTLILEKGELVEVDGR